MGSISVEVRNGTVWMYHSTPTQLTHLELQHQVHPLFPKWVDVIEDQGNYDINTVGLVCGNAILEERKCL